MVVQKQNSSLEMSIARAKQHDIFTLRKLYLYRKEAILGSACLQRKPAMLEAVIYIAESTLNPTGSLATAA
ncbi:MULTISPECIES: hypothetical protein [unclassified Rhizobium]|uniref:hypothetical protein n=1 Tax=unclassified Rhizobium TaxID=2613769 RepID=UPI0012E35138|nr:MULTISPECIES: hypothetical protein [unclassified Rhizobium]